MFDKDENEKKIIYIDAGEYDLYEEYRYAISHGWLYPVPSDDTPNYKPHTDYFDYNVYLPNNIKLIGLGDVIFKWDPPDSPYTEYNNAYTYRVGDFVTYPFTESGIVYICNTNIDTPEDWNPDHWSVASQSQIDNGNFLTKNEATVLSPFNIFGDLEMDNITVIMSNGRYIVHDDPHNYNKGTRHIYKNSKFIRIRHRDGGWPVFGSGYNENGYYEYRNCYFKNTGGKNDSTLTGLIYSHEGNASTSSKIYTNPKVVVDSCVLKTLGRTAIRFSTLNHNGNDLEKIDVDINNCYIETSEQSNRTIYLNKYYPNSDHPNWNSGQFFNVKLLNSGNPVFKIDIGENNPYPPEVYPPVT